ncbi:MAG: hypothetical protein CVU52_07105 [Deltaproteobacteria bacterium HGW-Deltaproteobacteria-10]|nr:MAG: hypothetical protein CVU52_07105 [Deltaproteobacteria bacterium HGW-Deltaproteobacteria-10]
MKQAFLLKASIRLDHLLHNYKDNPALITPHGTYTFSYVAERLRCFIFNLEHSGIRKGNCVALYAANSELHLYLFLASWIMDFLYIPLDCKTPLSSLLTGMNIHFLVTDEKVPAKTKCIVLRSRQIMQDHRFADRDIKWPAIPFRRETSAIFTSGSTGKPRGIVHTVGNYIYSARGTNEFIGHDTSDRWLLSLPLYHVGGALIWVRTLLAGSACLLPDSRHNLASAILQLRPTVISLVPAQLIRLLEHKEMIAVLKQIKTILLGGAPTPPWLIDQSLDLDIPIMPTYGCTESCAQVTGVARGSARKAYHTAGRVVPYRDIQIGADGIIELGGKTLFKRYLHEPSTKASGENRFFQTADAGILDAGGNLVINGRTDGIFISGGENISPREIENRLLAQDGIITAIVVPAPHREFGLTPWAFVETAAPFDEKNIIDILRDELPGYKLPKRVILLNPANRRGKMKFSREALTKLARSIAEGASDA